LLPLYKEKDREKIISQSFFIFHFSF